MVRGMSCMYVLVEPPDLTQASYQRKHAGEPHAGCFEGEAYQWVSSSLVGEECGYEGEAGRGSPLMSTLFRVALAIACKVFKSQCGCKYALMKCRQSNCFTCVGGGAGGGGGWLILLHHLFGYTLN